MSLLIPAILLGLTLGAGLWLTLVRLPVMRATTFSQRISPQLRAVDHESRLLGTALENVTPFGPLERILAPVLRDAARRLGRFSASSEAVARRLEQAGIRRSVVDHRALQIAWAGLSFVVVLAVGMFAALMGRTSVPLAFVAAIAAMAASYLLVENWLSGRIRRRQQRILSEFPGVAELLALAVGAGSSTLTALERVSRLARGELSGEFKLTLAEARSGVTLTDSLQHMARRVQLAPVDRFVDGLSVAMERGTPLGDVLRAQAQDVRDVAKRELMESAGRKEIAMLAVCVFGILPLTVVFAVFPALSLFNVAL